MSLREIADETNISIRYLEALEEDRFDIVPGAVFTRGFLRQYSEYVGLDGDEVVNSYLAARHDTATGDAEAVEVRPYRKSRWNAGLLLALALVALLLAVGALALYVERHDEEKSPEPSPITAPRAPGEPEAPVADPPASAADPATPEEAVSPPAPLVAVLDFQGECWVEAFADGRRVASQLHVAGESLSLEAEDTLRLTLGDPTAVRLELNGEARQLGPFREGRVAEVTFEAPERENPEAPASEVAPEDSP